MYVFVQVRHPLQVEHIEFEGYVVLGHVRIHDDSYKLYGDLHMLQFVNDEHDEHCEGHASHELFAMLI